MKTATRLAGYALVLAALFGGGWLLGALVGPIGVGAPPGAADPGPARPSQTHVHNHTGGGQGG